MPQRVSLQNTIDQYIAALHPRFSPQTILAYSQALRLFTQLLRKQFGVDTNRTTAASLLLDWAYAYLEHLQATHSIETEHLYSRAILGLYQYIEQQHIAPSASTLATYLTQNRRSKRNFTPAPPTAAIDTILDHVSAASPTQRLRETSREDLRLLRDKAFLLTLALTGLRVSEICSLRKINVDLIHHTITLSDDLTLPLANSALSASTQYLAARSPLDQRQHLFGPDRLPLFARHDKKAASRIMPISRWTAANIVEHWATMALDPRILQELRTQHTPISPQAFRHYFVVTTLRATGDIEETRSLARHVNAATTRRYLRHAHLANQSDLAE